MKLNFTMFTSTFVHDGPIHLLVNMWATYNFLPSAGSSQLFEGNARHTLAFYLSTGVLTGLAGHVTLMFKKTNYLAYVRSGGASGALFAMFGVFCTQFPDAKVGILFVPVSFEAINFLPCVMAFDLYGMIRGYSFVNWGHAVSCAGLSRSLC
jgi:rhomboid-like protein